MKRRHLHTIPQRTTQAPIKTFAFIGHTKKGIRRLTGVEAQQAYAQRMSEAANQTQERVEQEMLLLDHDGNVASSLNGEHQRVSKLLTTAIDTEVTRTMNRFGQLNRQWSKTLGPGDVRKIQRWCAELQEFCDGKREQFPFRTNFSRKARRATNETNRMFDDLFELTVLYKTLSPHTFCFVPYDASRDKPRLEKAIGELLDPKNLQLDDRGIAIKSEGIPIYDRDRHYAALLVYVSTKTKSLKLKFVSFHESDGIEDKLDVEARFALGRFTGIAHYHVEKPYTWKRLNEVTEFEPAKYVVGSELSISPIGSVTGILRYADSSTDNIYSDTEKLCKWVRIAAFWNSNPVLLGGDMFTAAINTVLNHPRLISIQNYAIREFGPESRIEAVVK